MKDPKRIDRILDMLGRAWKRNPELRLCQLLGNCFQNTGDHYYEEDATVEALIKSTYPEKKKS